MEEVVWLAIISLNDIKGIIESVEEIIKYNNLELHQPHDWSMADDRAFSIAKNKSQKINSRCSPPGLSQVKNGNLI